MTTSANPLLVGIDLGTTNIKAAVYDPAGRVQSMASVPTVTHYPKPQWAYHEPEALWEAVCLALRTAVTQLPDPGRIASVAVASIGETGIPIDHSGRPTYDAIAWFDRRTIPQEEWIRDHLGEDRIFTSTGLSIQPIFSLCKMLWIRENAPERWQQTAAWLMAADYIAYRLSGARATDYSLASRSMAFNIHKRAWDVGVFELCGLDPDVMAEPVQSGTPIGSVTAGAAEKTLLPPGTVVGAGGHDHVVGALAAGAIHPDRMVDSMGTAEALFFPLEQPVTDPEFARQGYSQGAHVAPGMYYLFGGVYTSSACIEWIRDIFDHASYDELIDAAAPVPAGSLGTIFLPHLRLSNAPHPDSKARAGFIGLTSDATKGSLLRSIFEGIGFEARSTIEPALRFAQLPAIPKVIVIGGGAKNDFLLHVKSSILGEPLHIVDLEEATSLGAAMLGGIAAGIYRDASNAVDCVQVSSHIIAPDPEESATYDTLFNEVYVHLYDALKSVNHRIHDTVVDAETPESIG